MDSERPSNDDVVPWFTDRSSIVREIHERAPYSTGRFVRAARLTIAFPSLKERIRTLIDAQVESHEDFKPADVKSVIRAIGETTLQYVNPQRENDVLAKKEACIQDLLRAACDDAREPTTDKIVNEATDCVAQKIMDRASLSGTTWGAFSVTPAFGETEIDPTKATRPDGSVADVVAQMRSGEFSRLDLSWRKANNEKYRLRTRWEVFAHSHNYSVYEDLENKDAEPDTRGTTLKNFFNLKNDAITSFLAALDKRPNTKDGRVDGRESTLRSMCGKGGVLAAAYYWLVPGTWLFGQKRAGRKDAWCLLPEKDADGDDEAAATDVVERLRKYGEALSTNGPFGENDRDAVRADLRKIADAAREWFAIKDASVGESEGPRQPSDGPPVLREDFVFSYVAGGRALLLSDLRPDIDKTRRHRIHDYPSRTLIIDLGMTAEQRGRFLARLMDLSTFRHLALRGQPYVNAAIDALTQIGMALSLASLETHDAGKRAHLLRKLSEALDQLNLFFTYGISAKRTSTDVYSANIEVILEKMREQRISGWQTLNEYMSRYFASADQIARLANRYETLRDRVSGSATLVQAELSEQQRDHQTDVLTAMADATAAMQKSAKGSEKVARGSLRVGIIAIAIAIVGTLLDLLPGAVQPNLQPEVRDGFDRSGGDDTSVDAAPTDEDPNTP